MKIVICDDDINDIKHLERIIRLHSKKHTIYSYLSVEPFLKRLFNGEQFDLLFLDVQMPNTDGWELSKQLKNIKNKMFIAMVTVHGEYIFDCFDRVDWFAPKPVSKEIVWKIINTAQEKLYPSVILSFRSEKIDISLTAHEIIFFEIQRNDLFIHSTRGLYKTRVPLKSVKESVKDLCQFVQVHSSYIINLDYYEKILKGEVILKNGEKIKISRTYRQEFYGSLANYVQGG